MTDDRVKEVAIKYDNRLADLDVEPLECDGKCASALVRLSHVRWMCRRISEMVDEQAPYEKIQRWLGFVQGVLYADGIYGIDDLRRHVRTTEG
jgi:hypothetical protein